MRKEIFFLRVYVSVRTGGNFRPYVGKNSGVLCGFRCPASGGGEVEGKGRRQAVAEGALRGGEAMEEGLGLSEQVHEAAAQVRGAEGELGMGFQLKEAQFGFGLQGERGLALGIVFCRVAVFSACGREGVMHGRQGVPFGLQGFQQVEEAFLVLQGVGAGILVQEFELVLQLGDIIGYGHNIVCIGACGPVCFRHGGKRLLCSFSFAAPKENEPKGKGQLSPHCSGEQKGKRRPIYGTPNGQEGRTSQRSKDFVCFSLWKKSGEL